MKKIIVFALLFTSIQVFAKPAAKVLFAINKVSTQNHTLSRGDIIYTGDTITTATEAQTQIQYNNGTLVTIYPNSHYQVLDYEPNKNLSIKSKLSPGAIEYTSTGKKKSILQTPVVALAIEGTAFRAIATRSDTYIEVSNGLVIGHGIKIGPKEKVSSGTFDNKGHFTPGNIPWDTKVHNTMESNPFHYMDSNTTTTVTEIIPQMVADNAMMSTFIILAPLTNIAGIGLSFP